LAWVSCAMIMSARRRASLLVQDLPEIVDLLTQILNQRSTVYLSLTPGLRPTKDSFSGVGRARPQHVGFVPHQHPILRS
jgi:hypothetical protein